MYTHNFAYVGSRATGVDPDNYFFVGPGWDGDAPEGIAAILRSETDIIGTLTRSAWTGPEEKRQLQDVQRQYRSTGLSEFAGNRPPAPAPASSFPARDETRVHTPEFISHLNFILQFCPEVPAEKALRERFARIGIDAGRHFDAASLDPALLAAMATGIVQGSKEIEASISAARSSVDYFGTRDFLGNDFAVKRASAATMGIYGNSKEAVYTRGRSMPTANRSTAATATGCTSPLSRCHACSSSGC